MIKTTIDEIKRIAKGYVLNGIKWHFHILTPECKLNNVNEYSLILENAKNENIYICLSPTPYLVVGKELVQLLHGTDVIKGKNEKKEVQPSVQVKKILERAKALNERGIFWHHHMLFPYCKFNQNKGKWTILFEDKENKCVIESISETEPKGDLQYIEALFYDQKK